MTNLSNVPRSWTANQFMTVYIKMINILVVNDQLPVTKRNINGFIVDFVNDFMSVGDTIFMNTIRYDHNRDNQILFQIESRDIAIEDRNAFFRLRDRPNLNLIQDYLTLVNNLLKWKIFTKNKLLINVYYKLIQFNRFKKIKN